MQIEPPETIHFPIHSIQELQEQRGGLRVSALGSAALLPELLHGVSEQGHYSPKLEQFLLLKTTRYKTRRL